MIRVSAKELMDLHRDGRVLGTRGQRLWGWDTAWRNVVWVSTLATTLQQIFQPKTRGVFMIPRSSWDLVVVNKYLSVASIGIWSASELIIGYQFMTLAVIERERDAAPLLSAPAIFFFGASVCPKRLSVLKKRGTICPSLSIIAYFVRQTLWVIGFSRIDVQFCEWYT